MNVSRFEIVGQKSVDVVTEGMILGYCKPGGGQDLVLRPEAQS